MKAIGEGLVENLVHQGTLAAAGDAGNAGKPSQGKCDVDFLEVVLAGAVDGKPMENVECRMWNAEWKRTVVHSPFAIRHSTLVTHLLVGLPAPRGNVVCHRAVKVGSEDAVVHGAAIGGHGDGFAVGKVFPREGVTLGADGGGTRGGGDASAEGSRPGAESRGRGRRRQ